LEVYHVIVANSQIFG